MGWKDPRPLPPEPEAWRVSHGAGCTCPPCEHSSYRAPDPARPGEVPSYDAFVERTLADLSRCEQDPDVLGRVLAREDLRREGVWCEFGVAGGESLRRISAARGRAEVWGFDSFRGLPRAWNGNPPGLFARESIPLPPEGARLMVGTFEETLRCWAPAHPLGVTLVHVDCDLYESALCALEWTARWLAPGAWLVFDELHRYEEFRENEMRALWESGLDVRWRVSGSDRAAGVCVGRRVVR